MDLTTILPYKKYQLVTSLTEDELKKRIALNIEPANYYRLFNSYTDPKKHFVGEINGDIFKISRKRVKNTVGHNPIITGNITTFLGETHIAVSIKPPFYVFIQIALFAGGFAAYCICVSLGVISTNRDLYNILFLVTLVIAFYGRAIIRLNHECTISKRVFDALLKP